METLSRRAIFLISTRRLSFNLHIAHFSTTQSSSHYPSRRHDEDAKNVRVSVWWDVETCNLPVASTAYRIAHSITAALRANGIKGPLQISAYGNVFKLPKWTQDALSSTGITLTHVVTDGPGGKNSASRSMLIDLMFWVSQHPPPVHVFLISGDHDMATILHRLRMSNYNILLAAPEDTSTALCSAASIMWHWNNLVKGECLAGRHFNHPPDGPNGSWYGTYRVPLENSFPAEEQLVPTRDSRPAESETENAYAIPTEVIEQIRQILITYPKGVSIRSLRNELNGTGMDKLYGYKKFSDLLLAMPQILELRQQKDGQHLVCAVNPKEHESTDSPAKAPKNSTVTNTIHQPTPTPNQIKVGDDDSSMKSTDEVSTPSSCVMTNQKSRLVEPENPSPAICNEQPSPKGECQSQSPPSNEKYADANTSHGSVAIKKDNSSDGGFFRRTWTKWFGGSNDGAVMRKGDHSVQHGPSIDSSPSCYTTLDETHQPDLQKQGDHIEKLINQPNLLASMKCQEERKTRMLEDCQKLLDAIVKSHPGGYNIAGFKKLFYERYCYGLDLKFIKFDKLASLINTMSGVKLEGATIFPGVNSSSTSGSSDMDLNDDTNSVGARIDLDNKISASSTHSDSSDSLFDEQLGPVRSLNRILPSSSSGRPKPKTNKEEDDIYEPCLVDDIYTDSDEESPKPEEQAKGRMSKVHNEGSTLIDILSSWAASKDNVNKNNLAVTTTEKDSFQNRIKPHSSAEVSNMSSRSIADKLKPQRTFNFVSDGHRKKVDLKITTEPRQEC